MNISFLPSIFKKTKIKSKVKIQNLETILIKKLKKVSANNSLFVYENITVYNHAQKLLIPLLIVDLERGIYLFEDKSWSFDDLKNSTILKATQQNSTEKSLAFEKTQDFIRLKFNELSHNDGASIYNYLLMENLNQEQYHHLDDSYKTLLPFEKVIFNDTPEEDMLKKLQQISLKNQPYKLVDIVSNLFIQYIVLDGNTKYIATKEQVAFIDSHIEGCVSLFAKQGSGKTSAILLKALTFVLEDANKTVAILKPTNLDSDLLKYFLNQVMESAMVEVDIDSIKILTIQEFESQKFKKIDLIICDDVELIEYDFIEKLKKIRKSTPLVLATSKRQEAEFKLTKTFKKHLKYKFTLGQILLQTLEIISDISKENKLKDIMVFSNHTTREKIFEELEVLLPKASSFLYSSHNLVNQEVDKLLLSTYDDVTTISKKFILLIDVEHIPIDILKYVSNQAIDTVYIIYENKSEKITFLRDKLT